MIQTQVIHTCPNGCKEPAFITSAHVTQDWEVDPFGEFQKCVCDCTEVDSEPDNDNIWGCAHCGAEADSVECRIVHPRSRTASTVTLYIETGVDLSVHCRVFNECGEQLEVFEREGACFVETAGCRFNLKDM